MDLATTTKVVHDGTKGKRAEQRRREELKDTPPIQKTSNYQQCFPNWRNGKQDIFHEKMP